MKILFVHQNFPGQFKHLAPALATAGHEVHALAIEGKPVPGVRFYRYRLSRGNSSNIHPLALEFEAKLIRGEACAQAMMKLRAAGFTPDMVVAHPGWGETLFVKDVWPETRLLSFLEFYYAARGTDVGFDPEFSRKAEGAGDLAQLAEDARLRVKNANNLLSLEAMDWGFCPTEWQKSTLPAAFRDRVSVIFDGIDTDLVRPDPAAQLTLNPGARVVKAGDEVITFVNRNLEPYRGYHVFMRALPEIQRFRPNALILIVGGNEVSYGAKPPAGTTWREIFLKEVGSRLDRSRVRFLGKIPYLAFLKVLQVSAAHVYLTYPFVLSWSSLEAMSAGCLVVGSNTPPVREAIEHRKNGLLVDFFDIEGLARTVAEALEQRERFAPLRMAARETAVARYDLKRVCLPQQIELVNVLASGRLPRPA